MTLKCDKVMILSVQSESIHITYGDKKMEESIAVSDVSHTVNDS